MSVEKEPRLNSEAIRKNTNLTFEAKPSAWSIWQEAMPEAPATVELKAARVQLDDSGDVVAFGARRAELLRTIELYGDLGSAAAKLIGIEPQRITMFTADGERLWPVMEPIKDPVGDFGHSGNLVVTPLEP